MRAATQRGRNGRRCSLLTVLRGVEGNQLLLDHRPQGRQAVLYGSPYVRRRHIFVVVAVDVASAGHFLPRDRRMPRLERARQPARGLRDDLETPRDGINRAQIVAEPFVIEPRRKADRQFNVVRDVAQRAEPGVRTHKLRLRWPPAGYTVSNYRD